MISILLFRSRGCDDPSAHRPPIRPAQWFSAVWRRTMRPWAIRLAVLVAVILGVLVVAAIVDDAGAYASVMAAPAKQPKSIGEVISNIRTWLVGILLAVATLFMTIGFLRYTAANGDPAEVEKAKMAFKSAGVGYAGALLAPLIVTIIGKWVSG